VAAFNNNMALFVIEYLVAGLTAFYMFRLYFSVFWGKDRHYHHTPHESPLVMTIPLMLLALASMIAGFLPFSTLVSSDKLPFESVFHFNIAAPSVAIGLLGIAIAWLFYKKETSMPENISRKLGILYKATYNKFYIDEIYLFITKKILFNFVARPVAWFDRHVVDDFMAGIGYTTVNISKRIKGLQSGQLQHYGFAFVAGTLALVLILLYLL
jgi:NADH-quinone oxidoreductase subunit L